MTIRALILDGFGLQTLSTLGRLISPALPCVTLLCASLLSVGCGQDDPPVDGPDATLQPYHPLVPGSRWEYAHTNWDEVVTLDSAEFNGQPAYFLSDSPNPSDDLRSDAIITSVDGRVSRVTKDEYLIGVGGAETLTSSVSYGVGFTRFNEDWATREVGYKETPEYQRVETPPGGMPRAPEDRRHTFEIISLHEDVPTPIGSFDCIKIRRTKDWQAEQNDDDEAQAKLFWFARGVGKVQEQNEESGNTEVLTSYEIPEL
jgi:hypothetical protein